MFFGKATIGSHNGKSIRMWYKWEGHARGFVDSLNQLVSGHRR